MHTPVIELLNQVAEGRLSAETAAVRLKTMAEKNLGFARVDLERAHRRGLPEVIYCPGKTTDQITAIISALTAAGQNVLATRATPDQFAVVQRAYPKAVFHEPARLITLDVTPPARANRTHCRCLRRHL